MAELHKCEPSGQGLTTQLVYSGTDPNVCQITVSNVAENANATWSTRLGDEMGRTSYLYGTFDFKLTKKHCLSRFISPRSSN